MNRIERNEHLGDLIDTVLALGVPASSIAPKAAQKHDVLAWLANLDAAGAENIVAFEVTAVQSDGEVSGLC